MKNYFFYLAFSLTYFVSNAQSIEGKWKTIDDVSGKPKSVVEVYTKGGKLYAKIVEILDVAGKNKICDKCSGDDKNKPILGLTIIKGLSKDGSEYNSGEILDPKTGKLYKCNLALESSDKLKVRGYIGFSLLGRTQYWHRIN